MNRDFARIFAVAFTFAAPIPLFAAPAFVVTGRAIDEAGLPLSGATVELCEFRTTRTEGLVEMAGRPASAPLFTDRTDAAGEFRLEVEPMDFYSLRVLAPGRLAIEVFVGLLAAPTDLGLLVLPEAEEVEIQILGPKGQEISGASVAMIGEMRTPREDRRDVTVAPRRAMTGAAGQVRLARLVGEQCEVAAVAAGFAPATLKFEGSRSATLSLEALSPRLQDSTPGDGTAPPRGKTEALVVRGRVVRAEDGGALAAALVLAAETPELAVTSAADGTFELATPAGSTEGIVVAAVAPGRAPGIIFVDRSGDLATIELARVARVTGTVVDAAGRAVAGVEVAAEQVGIALVPRFARTAENGVFELDGLAPGAAGTLVARVPKRATGRLALAPLAPGENREGLALVLVPHRGATGRVVDAADRPVAGARAKLLPSLVVDPERLTSDPFADISETRAKCGADGRFRLPGVPAGSYDLTVEATGKVPVTLRGIEIGSGTMDIEVGTVRLQDTLALAGRVTDEDGEPVAGAEIRVSMEEGTFVPMDFAERPLVHSAADGAFVVPDLHPGDPLVLEVHHAGYAKALVRGLELPRKELVVVLAAAAGVSGRVTDSEGRPLAGARVSLGPSGERWSWSSSEVDPGAETDAEGNFAMGDLEAGTFALRARAEGFVPSEPLAVELVVGGTTTDVTIALKTGALLSGQVFGPDGAVLGGAWVHAQSAGPEGDPLPPVRTDAEGRYEWLGLSPGKSSISVGAEGLLTDTRTIVVNPGRNVRDFQLAAGYTLAGRVVDSAGQPVSTGSISYSFDREGGQSTSQGPLNSGGIFAFSGLPAGNYRLRALSPTGVATVDVRLGPDSSTDLVLRTDAATTLTGAIAGLDRDSPGETWVSATRGGRDTGLTRSSAIDSRGRYRIENLTPGQWTVWVSSLDREQAKGVEITEGQGAAVLDFDLGDGHRLEIHVVRGERSVPGIRVNSLGYDGGGSQGLTDENGRTALLGLEPGRYQIQVSDDDLGMVVSEDVEIDGDRELVFDLGGLLVTGRALSMVGEPLVGALVRLESIEARAGWSFLGPTTHTTEAGTFRFPEVPAGRYRVVVIKTGFAEGSQVVTVEGDSAEVEIRLSPNPRIPSH